ncbi:MAG: serine hydrolase domain-containing protein [Pseudohongiellaceae bacterium]
MIALRNQLTGLMAGTCLVLAGTVTAQENLSHAEPEDVGMSSERLGRIAPMIQSYVDQGELVGATSMVARHGQVVHFETYGDLNRETGQDMQEDSLFRIFSMTKPITSLAVMQLYEQGLLQLDDPVARYLPGFADVRVVGEGGALVEPEQPMTVRMLLTHSAGLTYGVFGDTLIDRMYREAGVMESPDLTTFVDRLSEIPLQYQPGTRFHYSVATDVLGGLVEVISGQELGEYFREHIFAPLGMNDTFFRVPPEKVDRYGTNHTFDPATGELQVSATPVSGEGVGGRGFESGGGGLVSSTEDYMRFAQMLLNGGELAGERVIGRKTLDYMTENHLPAIFADRGVHAPDTLPGFVDGTGFGLGFAVIEDPKRAGGVASKGEYYWGGAAGTIFWIDPAEDLAGVVMIQHMNVQVPLRAEFKALTYSAIAE